MAADCYLPRVAGARDKCPQCRDSRGSQLIDLLCRDTWIYEGLILRRRADLLAQSHRGFIVELRGTVVQRIRLKRCEATVMDNEFDMESDWITELGKARSDEYTEKILAFVQELEKSAPEPFLPLLTDLALARTLIVHLTLRYGPERGPKEARIAFETTLAQLKPILERYYREKGTPPQ